jgi:enoyl-CoA hydratase/carnithine racemase
MYWSIERTNGLAVLDFSRPPRNMMSFAAMEELLEALVRLEGDPAVDVIVLTSSTSGYFVAHGDLDDLVAIGQGRQPSGDVRIWGHTLATLERIPQPVIAAVNGQAWGGGCEIALACAVRLASEAAHFAQPEIDLGIIPGAGGTTRLARHVGLGRATEMILTGRRVDAAEALAIGLVQAVLPADDFRGHVLTWASRLADKSGPALRAAKESVLFGAHHSQRDALKNEARLFLDLQRSDDTLARQRAVLDLYGEVPPGEAVDLASFALGA